MFNPKHLREVLCTQRTLGEDTSGQVRLGFTLNKLLELLKSVREFVGKFVLKLAVDSKD